VTDSEQVDGIAATAPVTSPTPGPESAPATAEIDDSVAGAASGRVREAVEALDAVRDLAPEEQVTAFAAAQRTLAATLSDIDNE
jgi:hypothetical protein